MEHASTSHDSFVPCSACAKSWPLEKFPAIQRTRPANRRRCAACVLKLLDGGRMNWEARKEHARHNLTPNMTAAYAELHPNALRDLELMAETRLAAWCEAELADRDVSDDACAPPPDARFEVLDWSRLDGGPDTLNEVCLVHDVLTSAQCDAALEAIHARAATRGGWQTDRHRFHPTTDMRCAEALFDCPAVEQMVRAAVFSKVCEPLAGRWAGAGYLAEHLVFRDLFFVHYSAADGAQRGLKLHEDGSLFSFNVLLNSPSEFDGGGTYFTLPGGPKEHGHTVSIPRGAALVHSGRRKHGGRDITRGTRDLLVGFMGLPRVAPSAPSDGAGFTVAARESFCKFGAGAWSRADRAHADAAEEGVPE